MSEPIEICGFEDVNDALKARVKTQEATEMHTQPLNEEQSLDLMRKLGTVINEYGLSHTAYAMHVFLHTQSVDLARMLKDGLIQDQAMSARMALHNIAQCDALCQMLAERTRGIVQYCDVDKLEIAKDEQPS